MKMDIDEAVENGYTKPASELRMNPEEETEYDSTVMPFESVVSVLACIMMAAGHSSSGRRPAANFHSRTSGILGKWLYDHYLKLMNNCVSWYLDG